MTRENDNDFYARIERHPELKARFCSILDVAEGKDNGPDTADAVEERTLEEVRKLGNEIVTDWAVSKSTKALEQARESSPEARPLKKNSSIGTPALERFL